MCKQCVPGVLSPPPEHLGTRLTGNHDRTEIKKTLNYTVIRKGMLGREYHPTINRSKLEYALRRPVAIKEPLER